MEFKGTILGNLMEGGALKFADVSVFILPPAAQCLNQKEVSILPLTRLRKTGAFKSDKKPFK